MKTSFVNALVGTAAFFALCASAVACDADAPIAYSTTSVQDDFAPDAPVVGTPPTAPTTGLSPANLAAIKARAAELKAAAARAKSLQATTAATVATAKQSQARLSVVSTSSPGSPNAANVPTARVRVVTPGSTGSKPVTPARVVVVTPDDTSKTAVAPPKPVVKPQPVTTTTPDETSKISDSLKGLVGDWMAVSRQGDGELSTVELQLDDHGWAKLTVPGPDGKPSTTQLKAELKDNKLELTSKSGTMSLGTLVSADSRQMVLDQGTGLATFVRP